MVQSDTKVQNAIAASGEVLIGGGFGLLVVTGVDAVVGGPISIATKRREIEDRAQELDSSVSNLPKDAASAITTQAATLRDSKPNEWFPYDTAVESVGGVLGGAVILAAITRYIRTRRRML